MKSFQIKPKFNVDNLKTEVSFFSTATHNKRLVLKLVSQAVLCARRQRRLRLYFFFFFQSYIVKIAR